MSWKAIERPGYFGKKRDEIKSSWNRRFGEENWRLTWEFGDVILPKNDYLEQVYTVAYYEHLKKNSEDLKWLTSFKDVWDTAESNVEAAFDFNHQETPNNHYHDIAIRRAMTMLGAGFQGDKLLHVRWKDSKGYKINPGVVPFHRPELVPSEDIEDFGGKGQWWFEKTIEDAYQKMKLLQIRE